MYKAVIITINDSCATGQKEDTSGKLLMRLLTEENFEIISKVITPHDKEQIEKHLNVYLASDNLSFIATVGGTGIGYKDYTPDITRNLIEKEIPGVAELMRMKGAETYPSALLSRAVAGIKNKILIINFPGNPKAVQESFDAIKELIPHIISMLKGEPR
ncbi:MAG: hypothetical protein A2Y62_03170 [Candidatus Fischerbacteria bacterium RBG_13_37_8]|uniref:MoaB/Mog domain-containing protein n=1 Tax=Candidatus Fischerbacteria bacterium RBG_13_37_8 TaxID=1817863 RepID=A0A1F5VV02_9BACT|nr:MAG: hypothetical protein A2Y62_03170 [Candidatus Fischerbacteria bacterium RBG_13_37_8]